MTSTPPGTTQRTFWDHAAALFLRALSLAAAALAVSWAWWGDRPVWEAAALAAGVADMAAGDAVSYGKTSSRAMSDTEAIAVYQHALRRCLEPLTRRCTGPASPVTVQRFIDHATGAAVVYAKRIPREANMDEATRGLLETIRDAMTLPPGLQRQDATDAVYAVLHTLLDDDTPDVAREARWLHRELIAIREGRGSGVLARRVLAETLTDAGES